MRAPKERFDFVHEFLNRVFIDDLHAKRVLSLAMERSGPWAFGPDRSPVARDGALVLGHYWPSSIPTNKTPDATAKTSHTAPTAPLTGKTNPRPIVSIVAHINPLNAICEILNI